MKLLLPCAFSCLLTMCATFYENGHKIASVGSNVESFAMRTPRGTVISAGKIDNAVIHRTLGDNVTKGGAAVATSGILGLFH